MNNKNSVFGLVLVFAIAINAANLSVIFYYLVTEGNPLFVFAGALAVLAAFFHAVLCDKTLRGAND
ncbi:hypothetical protein [Acinetobacter indicus]|uniref:hypothetical protein n=1 Tax=Acinetobacter indicus TaxID=756892 RepID=UPI001444513C|nr:hypothetical protein [Acinetobacter indicus]